MTRSTQMRKVVKKKMKTSMGKNMTSLSPETASASIKATS